MAHVRQDHQLCAGEGRRGNGSGTVGKRADGRWGASYMVPDGEGHRVRKMLSGRSRREVRRRSATGSPEQGAGLGRTPGPHRAVSVKARRLAGVRGGQVDTAHLLLAITSDPADPAYRILQTLGVDPALIPGELERLDQAS